MTEGCVSLSGITAHLVQKLDAQPPVRQKKRFCQLLLVLCYN